ALHRPHPLLQPRALDLAPFESADRGERAGGDGGRERGGEEEARRIGANGVAAGFTRRDIAAHDAEALGEGSVYDVDAIHDPVRSAMPPPRRPYRPTAWTSST